MRIGGPGAHGWAFEWQLSWHACTDVCVAIATWKVWACVGVCVWVDACCVEMGMFPIMLPSRA